MPVGTKLEIHPLRHGEVGTGSDLGSGLPAHVETGVSPSRGSPKSRGSYELSRTWAAGKAPRCEPRE